MDHNWRQQIFEEIKALVAKKKKSKSIIKKEKSTILPTRLSLVKKNNKKEHCKHYDSIHNIKKSCYYFLLAN